MNTKIRYGSAKGLLPYMNKEINRTYLVVICKIVNFKNGNKKILYFPFCH